MNVLMLIPVGLLIIGLIGSIAVVIKKKLSTKKLTDHITRREANYASRLFSLTVNTSLLEHPSWI